QNGNMQDLGTLGGCSSDGTAINASGIVVGKSDTTGNCGAWWQAFEYVGGHMVALGVPPGTGVSTATAINSKGVIVGYGGDQGDHVGFVIRGSGMEVLNNLIDPRFGWSIEDTAAVDDLGRITGTGFRFGKIRAFLLTPSVAGSIARSSNTVRPAFGGKVVDFLSPPVRRRVVAEGLRLCSDAVVPPRPC